MTVEEGPLAPLLRRQRAAAGLTQEELAERAGVSVRTISDVERGLRTSIYRDTAQRLASALRLREVERARFESVARGSARRGPRDVSNISRPEMNARIPIPPSKMIGRERELQVVVDALAADEIRLLTLTGPGGIGKTRIAIEAAIRAQERGERVVFLSLGGTDDARLVASTVAVALGVTSPGEPSADSIAEHLAGASALLVLDTFEHLMDAGTFVASLLARSHGLKILVTSREALHLSGEHEIALPTLEGPMSAWESPVEDVLQSPSTELFVRRAQAARNDFAIDDDSALVVRDICARLNGLPLAIELAAARVKHLSLRALSAELDDRFSVLTGGPRDLPRRQRTMRDTVAWSYELLSPGERSLFRKLSVFSGGWSLEAATSICGERGEVAEALELMSALVDKSLVFVVEPRGGDTRYSMLDVVREYALERCAAAGEVEWLAQKHAEFYVTLAEQAEPQLGGSEQSNWFRRLELEHDNLRAALAWLARTRDAERALRLAGALWQFWRRQGHLSEGRMWLRRALAIEPSRGNGARAKALWGAGWLAFAQGAYEEGETLSAELIHTSRRRGDRLEERNGLTVRGMILMARGRLHEALESFEEGLEICLELGTSWHLATSYLNLGMAKMHSGDLKEAETVILKARQVYAEVGDEHFEARCLGYLGYTALLAGDGRSARSFFTRSLETFRRLGDLQGIAEGLEGLSALEASSRDREARVRGARLAGAADSIRAKLTAKQYPFDKAGLEPYLERGRVAMGENEWERARQEGERMSLDAAIAYALQP